MMNKKNILLLDDDREIRELVRDILKAHVPEARFYESAEAIDAYHKFARQAFDLLILDIGLPRYDGYQVLQHIQEMPKHLRPKKILILSGHATEDQVRAHWNEPVEILLKPCRSSELRSTVIALLKDIDSQELIAKVP